MKSIGIYGGTFNPPHVGHVLAAEAFANALPLDDILIIPDFLPPHKELDVNVPGEDRLQMCRLAFSHIRNVHISDIEIRRGGRSYTAVTLEEISAPDTRLYLLCGTDMFLTLDEWYKPETIFELATVCYVRRERYSENDVLLKQKTEEYVRTYNASVIPITSAVKEVSSTDLRNALKDGKISRLLPTNVCKYITEKGLYR